MALLEESSHRRFHRLISLTVSQMCGVYKRLECQQNSLLEGWIFCLRFDSFYKRFVALPHQEFLEDTIEMEEDDARALDALEWELASQTGNLLLSLRLKQSILNRLPCEFTHFSSKA